MPGNIARAAAFRALCNSLSSITQECTCKKTILDCDGVSWPALMGLAKEYRVSSALACVMESHRPESLPEAAARYFQGLAAKSQICRIPVSLGAVTGPPVDRFCKMDSCRNPSKSSPRVGVWTQSQRKRRHYPAAANRAGSPGAEARGAG